MNEPIVEKPKHNIARVSLVVEDFEGVKREIFLPLLEGNLGQRALVDLSPLNKAGEKLTLVDREGRNVNPHGLTDISFVDGDNCKLYYRGYDYEKLIDRDYVEIVHLLLFGKLPNDRQCIGLDNRLNLFSSIPEQVKQALKAEFYKGKNPYDILTCTIMNTGMVAHEYYTPEGESFVMGELYKILGMMPALTAAVYHITAQGDNKRDIQGPPPEGSYIQRLEHMLFSHKKGFAPDTLRQHCLNLALVTMAEHGSNNSMSNLLATYSTATPVFKPFVNCLNALSGLSHGGAAESVMIMFEDILKSKNQEKAIRLVVEDFKAGIRRFPGLGHRVYRGDDPRYTTVRNFLMRLKELGYKNERLDIALELKAAIEKTERFNKLKEIKMGFNLDYMMGTLESVGGLPSRMAGAMFGFSRSAGGAAHIREETDFSLDKTGDRMLEQPKSFMRHPEASSMTKELSIDDAPPPIRDWSFAALERSMVKSPAAPGPSGTAPVIR